MGAWCGALCTSANARGRGKATRQGAAERQWIRGHPARQEGRPAALGLPLFRCYCCGHAPAASVENLARARAHSLPAKG
jgi:hypothetical protein